jgi:hypothetical protein
VTGKSEVGWNREGMPMPGGFIFIKKQNKTNKQTKINPAVCKCCGEGARTKERIGHGGRFLSTGEEGNVMSL